MKILKLLNNNHLPILIIIFLLSLGATAEDNPVDIWNIDQNKNDKKNYNNNEKIKEVDNVEITQASIYDLQSQRETDTVQVDSSLDSQEVKIIGLYDPEDYDLKIDLWSNSNGDQLKDLFSNLAKLDLSKDASELMNIIMLTNSYYPEINITENEFIKIKSNWLLNNKNMD